MARDRGVPYITFRVETVREAVRDILGEQSGNDVLDICQVFRTERTQVMAGLELLEDDHSCNLATAFRFWIN